MTKPTKAQGKAAGTPAPQARGSGHQWQGDAVEDPAPEEEESELKASRAEGNELLDVHEAIKREATALYPETFALGREGDRPPPDGDDAENVEEKRQAAAEEHARVPSRRPPHGNL